MKTNELSTGYLGNNKLKKDGIISPWTDDQLKELRKCARDPIYFAKKYVHIFVASERKFLPFAMRPYQEKMLKAFMANRETVCKLPRQSGKALSTQTLIPTPDGFKKMGDICVGDKVFGRNGEIVTVTVVSPIMYAHTCYDVVFNDGSIITADADHIWRVHDRWSNKSERDMTTQEMLDSGVLIGNKNESRFKIRNARAVPHSKKDVTLDPYLFGYWLGDGTSATGTITHHEVDSFFIGEFEKFGYRTRTTEDKRRPHIKRTRIYGLTRVLKNLGALDNKHIPDVFKYSDIDDRFALLQGIMDTDGTVKKNSSYFEITMKEGRLIDDIQELIQSLGIIVKKNTRIIRGRNYTRLLFGYNYTDNDKQPPFRLKRKIDCVVQSYRPEFDYRFIKEIRIVNSIPVKCIGVSGDDHMYLAGNNYIPTHNTTVAVAFFLWCTIFQGAFKIAILANKHPLARDILKRYQEAYERLPKWMQQGVKVWNKGDIELENGAKIKTGATTSSSIRGETFNLVFLDEFAHISSELAAEFFQSVHPTITEDKDAKMIVVSTPKGMNHFHKMWVDSVNGKSSLTPVEILWNEVPGRNEAFRKKIIDSYGEDYFEQEYACEFIGGSNTLISASKLKTLVWIESIKSQIEIEGLKLYFEPIKNRTYTVTCDTSRGLGNDYSAFIVVDITEYPHKVVATYRNNKISAFYFPAVIATIARMYNDAYILVETNDLGESVINTLYHDLEYENLFTTKTKERRGTTLAASFGPLYRLGVKTSKTVKAVGCTNLKTLIETDKFQINDHTIFQELNNFVSNGVSYAAVDGEHDDLAMCCVLHAWMVTQEFFKAITDSDLRKKIQEDESAIYSDALPFGFITTGEEEYHSEEGSFF